MKKHAAKLLPFFLILLFTALIFTSCFKDEPKIEDLPEEERAAAVFAKTNEQMEKVKSFKTEEKLSFDFTLENQKILIEFLSTIYATDKNSGNYAETSEYEYNFYLNGIKKESNTTTEGFRDGVMFFSSVEGINKSSLKSEITLEDYKKHIEDMNAKNNVPDFDKFFSTAKTTSAEKKEDGSWVATFTDPSEESLENFTEYFKSITELMGEDIEITNVYATFSVTSLFLVDKIELNVILDSESIGGTVPLSASSKSSGAPSITLISECFNYDSAEQPNNINLDKYTDVPDLRKLFEINYSLGELINKTKGSFSSNIKHTVSALGETNIYREKDICEYGNLTGGFSYELFNESSGKNYIIAYDDGKQTVSYIENGVEEELQKVDSTDLEQKQFIESMLDEGNFSIYNVSSFTKKEKQGNVIYTFDSIAPNQEIVDSVISSLNLIDYTGTETISIELDANGNVVKYTYDVSLTIEARSYYTIYTITYDIEVECAYGTILSDVQ